jgi:hypothetical protein
MARAPRVKTEFSRSNASLVSATRFDHVFVGAARRRRLRALEFLALDRLERLGALAERFFLVVVMAPPACTEGATTIALHFSLAK